MSFILQTNQNLVYKYKIILCHKYDRDCHIWEHLCGYVVPCVHSEDIKKHERLIVEIFNYKDYCKISHNDIDHAFDKHIYVLI